MFSNSQLRDSVSFLLVLMPLILSFINYLIQFDLLPQTVSGALSLITTESKVTSILNRPRLAAQARSPLNVFHSQANILQHQSKRIRETCFLSNMRKIHILRLQAPSAGKHGSMMPSLFAGIPVQHSTKKQKPTLIFSLFTFHTLLTLFELPLL